MCIHLYMCANSRNSRINNQASRYVANCTLAGWVLCKIHKRNGSLDDKNQASH